VFAPRCSSAQDRATVSAGYCREVGRESARKRERAKRKKVKGDRDGEKYTRAHKHTHAQAHTRTHVIRTSEPMDAHNATRTFAMTCHIYKRQCADGMQQCAMNSPHLQVDEGAVHSMGAGRLQQRGGVGGQREHLTAPWWPPHQGLGNPQELLQQLVLQSNERAEGFTHQAMHSKSRHLHVDKYHGLTICDGSAQLVEQRSIAYTPGPTEAVLSRQTGAAAAGRRRPAIQRANEQASEEGAGGVYIICVSVGTNKTERRSSRTATTIRVHRPFNNS
jgi:hypothetical protein